MDENDYLDGGIRIWYYCCSTFYKYIDEEGRRLFIILYPY